MKSLYGKNIIMEKGKENNEPGVVFAPYILCQTDTESETYKIAEKLRKLNDSELFEVYSDLMREIYNRTHTHCPQCGSQGIRTTLVGYLPQTTGNTLKEMVENFKYRDLNRTTCCDCGWIGTTEDLK